MTVLIKSNIVKPGQKRHAVCNAYCYNAKNLRCTCSCGGKNHGVGLEKAIENTKQMLQEGVLEGVYVNKKALGIEEKPAETVAQ